MKKNATQTRSAAQKWVLLLTVVSTVLTGACGGEAGDEVVQDPPRAGSESITIYTDRTELFVEHPPLIAGVPGEPWAIHLTDLSDFSAVRAGRLTLEFQGPDGSTHSSVTQEPARPGVYSPAPALPSQGMYDLIMLLEGPQVSDEIFVGPIRVWASEAELPQLPEAESVGIPFLKEQQWPIDFTTVPAEERAVSSGVEVTGEFVGSPGAMAAIAAPVDGIVRWDLNRAAPTEGSRVTQGQPLVRISPVGGVDTYATLKATASRLQREVERTTRLVEVEAIPARRLEESRHDLEVVQAQLQAVGGSEGDGYTLTLRAPISGSVVRREFMNGERVQAGATLLTVIDARRLVLRLHVPAAYLGSMGAVEAVTFAPEGSRKAYRSDRLLSVGAALDPVRRTVPVAFEVDNTLGLFKAGMLVNGRVLSGEPDPAVAIPAEAVVDEDGLLVAYVQIGGETFERRALSIGATDGLWTTVISGVRNGERVVTSGQYQIKLGSLNTSEISDHGHPH